MLSHLMSCITFEVVTDVLLISRVNVSEEPVQNLGAMFDSKFTMVFHVNSVLKKAIYHLGNIGKVRKLLTVDATKRVMKTWLYPESTTVMPFYQAYSKTHWLNCKGSKIKLPG